METSNSNNLRCFFCLCSKNSNSNEPENQLHLQHLTFRNISRYVERTKILCDLNSTSSSSWFICNDCSQMADKFNELYHLLEVTKLELNWYLERMHGVMTMTKVNPSPDEIEKMTPPTFPRVTLCKIECPSLIDEGHYHNSSQSEEMDMDESMNTPSQFPDPTVSVPPVESTEMKMEWNAAIKEEPGINSLSKNKNGKTKRIRINVKQKDDDDDSAPANAKLQCSFCRARFHYNPSIGDIILRQHEAQYHCDQLFPNHKLESVTVEEFKKILGSLIWKDLINENEDTTCVYCRKKFKNSKNAHTRLAYISKLKLHFITTHYEKLEEKLEGFQRNPTISKTLRESDGEVCECGVYLQNLASRASHRKWHCPLTTKEKQVTRSFSKDEYKDEFRSVFSPVSKKSSSLIKAKLLCRLCKETFVTRGNAIRHWKYYCKKGKRLSIPNGESMACEYCDYQLSNRAWTAKNKMKSHYLTQHPEHYFKNEMEHQSLSLWKKKNFKSILVKTLFPGFILKESKTITKCSLCETKFNNTRYSYNLHLLKTHLINTHEDVLKQKLNVILNESDASLMGNLKKITRKKYQK